jgi:K+-sensing histidine kinase KdpD
VNLPDGESLPGDLFESAATNFLQNALEKRKAHSGLKIVARMQWDSGFHFSVCDDGQPVPDQLVQQLFSSPVQSNTGLGVGLYQSAKFAKEQGYRVGLHTNRQGQVCFGLGPVEKSAIRRSS